MIYTVSYSSYFRSLITTVHGNTVHRECHIYVWLILASMEFHPYFNQECIILYYYMILCIILLYTLHTYAFKDM